MLVLIKGDLRFSLTSSKRRVSWSVQGFRVSFLEYWSIFRPGAWSGVGPDALSASVFTVTAGFLSKSAICCDAVDCRRNPVMVGNWSHKTIVNLL